MGTSAPSDVDDTWTEELEASVREQMVRAFDNLPAEESGALLAALVEGASDGDADHPSIAEPHGKPLGAVAAPNGHAYDFPLAVADALAHGPAVAPPHGAREPPIAPAHAGRRERQRVGGRPSGQVRIRRGGQSAPRVLP